MDESVVNFIKWSTFIEPTTFLIAFSFGLSETVITDEILLKTCVNVLGENSTDCSSLSSLTSLQEIIQPRAATVLALKSFIENFIPAIVCIFFGSWSDRIGRKPILLIAATGTVIYYASLALLSYFNVDTYWYLAITLFTSLLGGFPVFIMSCYFYATDISNDTKYRRLNFVDMAIVVGKLAGCLVYPEIVKQFGYWATFTTSSVCCLVALIFAGLFLQESLFFNDDTPDDSAPPLWQTKIVKIIRNVFECLSVSFYVCFTLLVIALHDENIQGTSTTFYLYAQQFQWTLFNFSIYTAFYFAVTAVALLFLSFKFIYTIPCNSLLLCVIGFLSNLASAFVRAFAKTSTHIYLAIGVGAFSWISMYVNRRNMMKNSFEKELRKLFTIMTALERIVLSVMIPLNIYLCTNFITTYPHPVWLMQVSLQLAIIIISCLLSVCSFICMAVQEGDDD